MMCCASWTVPDPRRNSWSSMLAETSCSFPPRTRVKGLLLLRNNRACSSPARARRGGRHRIGGAKSGPYAAALAAELSKSGLDHLNLFQNVKEAVLASTSGAQQPWVALIVVMAAPRAAWCACAATPDAGRRSAGGSTALFSSDCYGRPASSLV